MAYKTVLALAATQAVTAHFGLVYPEWRADSLSGDEDSKYSQWIYPCAGVEYGAGNITDWPLEGGSVTLELHHPWSYVFINIGIGNGTDDFSTSLTPSLHNATSNGTLCVDKLTVPGSEIKNGTLATLQFITTSATGSALYNCADIRFSSAAKPLSNCTSEVKWVVLDGETEEENNGGDESTGKGSGGGDEGAAGMNRVNRVALAGIISLAVASTTGFYL